MRLLFFSYAYPNATSPTLGTFNRSLLAALARDHEVRVVSPVPFLEAWKGQWRGRSPLDSRYSAIPGVPADYLPFYYPPKILRERFGEFLWWSVQDRLQQAIRDFRPDGILSYWAHPDGEVAVKAGRLHDIPVVTMVGGSDVLLLARNGRRREAILNVLQNAEAVVAVSRHIADTLVRDGISPERLHVVRRGIDRQVFHPGDRSEERRVLGLPLQRPTMISVGRLVPVKGHTHLISACAELHREGRTFACHLLGSGPLRNRLQQQIQDHCLQGSVMLRDALPQAQLAQWYRAADVTVLPSLSEGIPNVLLESMSCGTPFVASRVGGVPEISDPSFDDLVPPEDPAALADALRHRLFDSNQRATNDSCRGFLPGSWDDSARELMTVFTNLGLPGASIEPSRERNWETQLNPV